MLVSTHVLMFSTVNTSIKNSTVKAFCRRRIWMIADKLSIIHLDFGFCHSVAGI